MQKNEIYLSNMWGYTHLVCFFYEIAEILHIQVNLNKKDSTYWHWYIYAVFFVNEKSIYWLLVFKIFGLKIWTCNFWTNIMSVFSESQIVTGTISSTGMRSRTQDIRQRATKKGFQCSTDRRIFTGNGWVNIPVGNYNWEKTFFLNLNKS